MYGIQNGISPDMGFVHSLIRSPYSLMAFFSAQTFRLSPGAGMVGRMLAPP
jgi:hypothetical protein